MSELVDRREPVATDEQRVVIEAPISAGPYVVDAGAGTGKTFTMVKRVAHLVANGMRADQFLVVTFTKAAASEIAGRLERELRLGANEKGPTCGTFHSIALDIIREFAYAIGISPDIGVIDEGQAQAIFAEVFAELEAGRLGVDLADFPLLVQTDDLRRGLAKLALDLRSRGIFVDAFLARARTAADALRSIGFGQLVTPGTRVAIRANSALPAVARTRAEIEDEARAERANVEVVGKLFARFDQVLEERAKLTFGDVLVRATALLCDHPQIAEQLRQRWRHAIVDEFQDTNRSQLAFLRALFGDKLQPVMVVGDVRQAIYEFNGADPQMLVEFAQHATRFVLSENRRSYQTILDLAHVTTSRLGVGHDPASLAALSAYRRDAEHGVVRVQAFQTEGPQATMVDDANGSASVTSPDAMLWGIEAEAAAIAGDIRRRIEIDGESPKDIAILMRSRSRAGVFIEALRLHGIAFHVAGGVGFFDAPEIRETIAWMRLVLDPLDAQATVATLQSAAIGLGDGAVAAFGAGEDLVNAVLDNLVPASFDAEAIARFERYRAVMRIIAELADAPLVDALRALITSAGIEIARSADPDVLLQTRANLDQLVRIAAALANDRPRATLRDLLADIEEREALELDLPPAPLEGERVTLSTIHASKGLEWKHVYVVNVKRSAFPLRNNGRREIVCLGNDGALALRHSADLRPTFRWYLVSRPDHTPEGHYWPKQASTNDAEEHRLFYVALTRARDSVTITGAAKGKHMSTCLQAVFNWVESLGVDPAKHRLLAPDESIAVHEPAPTVLPAITIDDIERLRERIARRATLVAEPVQRRGPLSYSAIETYQRCPRQARYRYVFRLPDLTDGAPAPASIGLDSLASGGDRDGRDPALFGRVVHKILEYDVQARIAVAPTDWPQFVADAIEAEAGETEDVAAIDAVARLAAQALGAYTPLAAEWRFTIPIAGVTMGGYVDFIGRDERGMLTLIDYKTGYTASDHYALQFALYAHAVEQAWQETPRCVLLRITDRTVQIEDVVPSSLGSLVETINASARMDRDEARPGQHCRLCPYAHDVCDAAPAGLGRR